MVRVVLAACGSAERGPLLVRGHVWGIRGWAWCSAGRINRHRGRLWGTDEPELPAGGNCEHQPDPGRVWPLPGLLLARLLLDRLGSLVAPLAGPALAARKLVPGANASRHSPAREIALVVKRLVDKC